MRLFDRWRHCESPTRTCFLSLVVIAAFVAAAQLHVVHRTTGSRRSAEPPPPPGNATGTGSDATPKPTPPTHYDRHVIGRMRMSAGRLGNEMFVYAAVIGIADRNRMTPIYNSAVLRRTFANITAAPLSSGELAGGSTAIVEYSAFEYDRKFETLADHVRGHVTVVGFFQSWKYFRDVGARVRSEYCFRSDIQHSADEFLRDVASKHGLSVSDTLYIGVHIRRSDMLDSYNVQKGYTVADADYLTRAATHVRNHFRRTRNIVFVVCSDDGPWARQNFDASLAKVGATPVDDRSATWLKSKLAGLFGTSGTTSPNADDRMTPEGVEDPKLYAVYSSHRGPTDDLALLASCNHTIMTVGTYGWWGAYLAGGLTVYYKNYPAAGSQLDVWFSRDDFYPPEWIGL